MIKVCKTKKEGQTKRYTGKASHSSATGIVQLTAVSYWETQNRNDSSPHLAVSTNNPVVINVVSNEHGDDEEGEDDKAVRGEGIVENVDEQLVQEWEEDVLVTIAMH